MKSMSSSGPCRCRTAKQVGGSLVITMLTIGVLSLIAANVLSSISARYDSVYRSGSWNEALLTAESGLDMTVSEVLRLVPNVSVTASGIGTGYSQPSLGLVTSLQFTPQGLVSTSTVLTLNPPSLIHSGEGGTIQQATVLLDVLPLSQLLSANATNLVNNVNSLLNGNDPTMLRLRSTGTVYLTGGTLAGPSRLDNDLWRASLFMNRNTGTAVSQPSLSRQVEAILRPVFPFESAVTGNNGFSAPDSGTVFDSFNSTSPLASTLGQYDSLKRLSHGTVRSNNASFTVGGIIYGDVYTNGGNTIKDAHETGVVNNVNYLSLPLVNAPTWMPAPLPYTSVSGVAVVPAGYQYKFYGITGTLHIVKTLAIGNNVTIYVNGDITGGITVDPGINAVVYVSGSIVANASQFVNGTGVASALQIYGVYPEPGATPKIVFNSDANLAAAIYAPGHDVMLNGNHDFSGSITGNFVQTSGPVRVHYDETLALGTGPLLRYQLASWREVIN